jgi:hypothetical protein
MHKLRRDEVATDESQTIGEPDVGDGNVEELRLFCESEMCTFLRRERK